MLKFFSACLLLASCLISLSNGQAELDPVTEVTEKECVLLQGPPKKPSPSLTQCYKYNANACCVSGHDSVIREEYVNLLSSQCFRKFFFLEFFFCMACSPEQQDFVVGLNTSTPTIKLCQSYADNIWKEDYESCGLNMKVMNPLITADLPAAKWEQQFETSVDSQIVLPKLVFENVTAFLNAIKPPFFGNYEIVVVDEREESCFSASMKIFASFLHISVTLFALTYLSV